MGGNGLHKTYNNRQLGSEHKNNLNRDFKKEISGLLFGFY